MEIGILTEILKTHFCKKIKMKIRSENLSGI